MFCTKCHTEKKLEDFSFRNREGTRRHSFCKQYHSSYRRQHYLQNKDKYITKARKWNKRQGEVLSKFISNKLLESPCVDCGEKDILVLEFDHLSNKKFGISYMFRSRHSLEAIENELKKCVVRCANCHRRKTQIETNSWRYKLVKDLKIGAW